MGVVPDVVFGLQPAKADRRNFMVEIDRGTMPVRRSDPEQTSFEGKMRVYLAAHEQLLAQAPAGNRWHVYWLGGEIETTRRKLQALADATASSSQDLRPPA